ncbi:uncharacterized protein LOC114654167 [Erpetoichthys calabaricus]|uniref:uncharacterized protein LOC114654167 n=1 Tax=Erpetoichthys calabaricus TaxID=27687 RepID=UPI0010A01488|nr:uncharacterized protein LOC114654167 [Erpetoichthys calabaricus]
MVIYSDTCKKHLQQIQVVFQTLGKAKFCINPKKCFFGLHKAMCLGYLVGGGSIKPQYSILKWPCPKTKWQVQDFLGLTGYYHQFIPLFSKHAVPLMNLAKKRTPNNVVWDSKADTAFYDLKQALTSTPVVMATNFSLPFILQIDSLDTC